MFNTLEKPNCVLEEVVFFSFSKICLHFSSCLFIIFQKKKQPEKRILDLPILARLRRPPAAFLLNGAITRGASGLTFFTHSCPSYMQSFIKIGGAVLEKNEHEIMTLCNFNKDTRVKNAEHT